MRAVLLLLCASSTQAASYHIGNSLTWDTRPQDFPDAAWHIACSRPLHWIETNPDWTCVEPPAGTWNVALAANAYDAVTVQTYPGLFSQGDDFISTAERDEAFFRLVAEMQPDARIIYYQPWPKLSTFAETWTQDVEFSSETPTTASAAYQNGLAAAFEDLGIETAPAGEAFYRIKLLADSGRLAGGVTFAEFYRDDEHASFDLGRYVAHQVVQRALFGELDAEYPFERDGELRSQLDGVVASLWMPADFTFDGEVSLPDFLVLKQHFGEATFIGHDGDATGDGNVDFTDFYLLKAGFGGGRTAAVPEPSGLWLAVLAWLVLMATCKRP